MRSLVVLLVIIGLSGRAVADDLPEANSDPQPVAAVSALASFYAAFGAFGFVAWYQHHKPLAQYKFGGDGWLGLETYAAGADKFGHAWSTMALARMGTEILSQWGGYDRTRSAIVSTALSELLFIGVEVSDGFYYEFSWSDLSGDTVGALLAIAFQASPRFDEMFDFRVQYWPSSEYMHDLTTRGAPNRLNIDDDYNGQTYLFAYHLGSIHALDGTTYGSIARYVDLTFGFDSRGYKPTPPDGPLPADEHHQNLFIGVSLNAQGVFDALLGGGQHERSRKITHGIFEVFNVPYTSAAVPGLTWSRTPSEPPTNAE